MMILVMMMFLNRLKLKRNNLLDLELLQQGVKDKLLLQLLQQLLALQISYHLMLLHRLIQLQIAEA
jgi:hypothetical protein